MRIWGSLEKYPSRAGSSRHCTVPAKLVWRGGEGLQGSGLPKKPPFPRYSQSTTLSKSLRCAPCRRYLHSTASVSPARVCRIFGLLTNSIVTPAPARQRISRSLYLPTCIQPPPPSSSTFPHTKTANPPPSSRSVRLSTPQQLFDFSSSNQLIQIARLQLWFFSTNPRTLPRQFWARSR